MINKNQNRISFYVLYKSCKSYIFEENVQKSIIQYLVCSRVLSLPLPSSSSSKICGCERRVLRFLF